MRSMAKGLGKMHTFAARDQAQLSANEYNRFVENSDKIAHALIFSAHRVKYSKQFIAPLTLPVDGTTWRPITNVREEICDGATIVRANTPNGTEMEGQSSLDIAITDASAKTLQHKFWPLSPTQPNQIKRARHSVRYNMPQPNQKVKSATWQVKQNEIIKRAKIKYRSPDQNTVMGHSAWEAGVNFYSNQNGVLHDDKLHVCLQNINAKYIVAGGSEQAQWRWEWLHGQAWSLSDMSENPQTPDNLAAAPKWVNSLMMVVERTARWHALNYPNAEITGKFAFTMIPDTEIMEHGIVEFTIKINGRTVVLKQDLDPWQTNPEFPRSTDIMQTALVTNGLLLNKPGLINRCI